MKNGVSLLLTRSASRKISNDEELFLKKYMLTNGTQLSSLLSLISDPDALQLKYAQYKLYSKWKKNFKSSYLDERHYYRENWRIFNEFEDYLRIGLLIETDKELIVDEETKETLEEFADFLIKKGMYPEEILSRKSNQHNLSHGTIRFE